MPTIDKARITSGTGEIKFIDGALTIGNNASTDPFDNLETFTITTANDGIKLYDSLTQTGNDTVLRLRNITGSDGITVSESNGVITIRGTSGSGGSNALITSYNVLANPRNVPGTAVGTSVSALLDLAIGDQFGALLYRGSSGWGLLSPGASGSTLQIGVEPTWQMIGFSTLPTSLQYIPMVCSLPGVPAASQQVWTIPIVLPFTLPTNCTGSSGIAAIAPTATAIFTLAYIRSGVSHTIGTITWFGSATTATFSTAAYSAQVGDTLILTAPAVTDLTFANIGIVVLATRSS